MTFLAVGMFRGLRIVIKFTYIETCIKIELNTMAFLLMQNICIKVYLIQNSQAVKKECGPEKGYGEKRCEIQGGGQEMAVMVG